MSGRQARRPARDDASSRRRYLSAMRPSSADVRAAAERLRGVIAATPLVHSPALSEAAGTEVHLKLECAQHTGSFKLRGAYNRLATLSPLSRARGVVASSAGNHGLGLAWAARALGVRARIFVPASAPLVKRDGILALGAEVDSSQPDYDSAHEMAERDARERGVEFINPCAGADLLAGQGTVALEILQALPEVATIVVPVGGGGLVGGVAAIAREEAPALRIVGAQSDRTNAMAASLAAGRRVEVEVPPTLADGLAGQVDEEGFETGRFAIDAMALVSEEEIASSIRWLARAHGVRVEGSGAVGVAAVRSGRLGPLAGPVAIIVSGGNIDEERWRRIVGQGGRDEGAPA